MFSMSDTPHTVHADHSLDTLCLVLIAFVLRPCRLMSLSRAPLSPYRGNTASVLRIVPYAAIHFSSFEYIRRFMVEVSVGVEGGHGPDAPASLPVYDLLAGSASGAGECACVLVCFACVCVCVCWYVLRVGGGLGTRWATAGGV